MKGYSALGLSLLFHFSLFSDVVLSSMDVCRLMNKDTGFQTYNEMTLGRYLLAL